MSTSNSTYTPNSHLWFIFVNFYFILTKKDLPPVQGLQVENSLWVNSGAFPETFFVNVQYSCHIN